MSAAPPSVSGPGKMSRRTDRSPVQKIRTLPDAAYGEAKEFNELQKQAPLANTPAAQSGGSSAPAGPPPGATPLSSVVPINAPTQRPDEPVTAGSNFGPGPGPEALGLGRGQADYSNARTTLASIAQASNNPEAAALLKMLQSRL